MNERVVCAAFIVVLASGCATQANAPEPAFEAALPQVAAQYRSEVRDDGKAMSTTMWRFWRHTDRIERENLLERTGEIWWRDGASLFRTLVYHADKRGIAYQPGDLNMTGSAPQWAQQAWIVSPALLKSLHVDSSGERRGIPLRRYKGDYANAQWDITLRLDWMVPQRVERKQGGRVERIELVDVYALTSAPWHPTPSRDYDLIDFADLGDHERDPFVMRLQSADGTHAHAH